MNWNWIYRDFMDSISRLSHNSRTLNKEAIFFQDYLQKNWDILNKIHFQPKNFMSLSQIKQQVQQIDWEKYLSLYHSMTDMMSFEKSIVEITERLCQLLEYPLNEQDIYVIVGLDCTTIYSTIYKNRSITVLCLESTGGDLREIELLLAHEAHHWKRQTMLQRDIFNTNVWDRCMTEGLSICFSESIQPDRPVYEYCFVPPETFLWTQANDEKLHDMMQSEDQLDDLKMQILFTRHPSFLPFSGMPPRSGYVFAYLTVKSYLTNINMDAIHAAALEAEFYRSFCSLLKKIN
ncbi:DUF2268 domain-containing putative Zn-dependent protease [Alicyclobacillus tolerans]|uniref:DUF2268 domain-containing protein n=1 Tax=Alicyclobacillus tolerans TaxID=90970 RepID=A0ABT9LT22_9BACL|nr:DUF2268 domain-containing putative Zn-dependent protease [Alicyclobacillus tengchongensis]MDP9727398.1 hypothetical protein [Alicyclobacillus tengchongensis]